MKLRTMGKTILNLLVSAAMVIAISSLGTAMGSTLGGSGRKIVRIFWLTAVILLLAAICSGVIALIVTSKQKRLSVADANDRMQMKREKAQSDFQKETKKLVCRMRRLQLYEWLVALLTATAAWGSGVLGGYTIVVVCSVFLTYGLFNRIRWQQKADFSQYEEPQEYPVLHELAHSAAKELGVDKPIRIAILSDCNAGIADVGKAYSIQLGAVLLNVLSKEELYQVLLHEFSHMGKEGTVADRGYRLFSRLNRGTGDYVDALAYFALFIPDMLFARHYVEYRMATAVELEKRADRGVILHGDPETFAGAVCKIHSYSLFEQEMDNFITEPYFQPEEPRKDVTTKVADAFKSALSQRHTFWKELFEREIQPLNASHPIPRKRMEAVGAKTMSFALPAADDPLTCEAKKALAVANRRIYQQDKENYAEKRKEYFLRPTEIVWQWEKAGKPLSAHEYRPVLDALCDLLRMEEAMQLCDWAIGLGDDNIAAHALWTKGKFLLERYDPAGIDLIYRSMVNSNYVEEGLDWIGNFCCQMGMEKELEEYRRRAVELMQVHVDQYDELSVLRPSDKMQKPDLPETVIGEIMSHVYNADENCLKRVFLVQKLLGEDASSYIFVLEFLENTGSEISERVYQKIFNYLDIRQEQFSLLRYNEENGAAVAKIPGSCLYQK